MGKSIQEILDEEFRKDQETLSNGYVTREIGETVYLDGYGMGQQSSGPVTITNIDFKYDEDTGKKYQIFEVCDSWYDARDGSSYGYDSMYFINL